MEPRDVNIAAPAATLVAGPLRVGGGKIAPPTEGELVTLLSAELREARAEVARLRHVASTVSNVALSLATLLIDRGYGAGGDRVVIPRELSDRLIGTGILVRELPDSDVEVTVSGRVPVPVVARD
jgi:hypothetical protein